MKKLKIVFSLIALAIVMSCADQDFIDDTEPIVDTIQQQKGTQSNGKGGGVQAYPCYNNSSAPNESNNINCTPAGSGSGSGN